MNDYVLSCCSTADLTKDHLYKRQISYICFHFTLDGKQYDDDLGKSIPFDQFYEAMEKGADTKTSQVNVEEFEEYFEAFLKEGKDILHLTLSSGISGAVNSAQIAKEALGSRYPQRKIYIVDSLAASSGYGLLMDKMADLRDEGYTIDELCLWAEEHKKEVNHWFFSSDLTFFIKGGRISKTAGFFGSMLNICPLMNVNKEGKLVPRFKLRTKKKAMLAMVDKMTACIPNGVDYRDSCYLSQSACLEDAKAVAELVGERFPHLKGKVKINSVGTVIGSHTGPGTVALFFWGKERTN